MKFCEPKPRKLADVRNSFLARFFNSLHLYFLYRFIITKLGFENPYLMPIKVTSRCNLNCRHCPWPKNQEYELSTEQLKSFIDKAYNFGCQMVTFEGGEPTLRPDLQELIDYAHGKRMTAVVITNGQNDLENLKPEVLLVSVEGDRDEHDKIRGAGTFDRLMANIEKNQDKNIMLLATISKANAGGILEMPARFAPLPIWFNFVYNFGNIGVEGLSREEIAVLGDKIFSLKRQHKNIINSRRYLKKVGRNRACHDWMMYSVNYNGENMIGCFVNFLEKEKCDECYVACYGESFHALNLWPSAIKAGMKIAGLSIRKIFSKQ